MAMSPDMQKVMDAMKASKGRYQQGTGSVKLGAGRNRIRILPWFSPKGDNYEVFRQRGVHWIKPARDAKPVAVVGCHDLAHGEHCPVCAAIMRARTSAVDDESLAIIKEWDANKSVIVNAIVREGPKKSDLPQVLELPPVNVWGKIHSTINEYLDMDAGNVLDPDDGFDFVIEKAGAGLSTTYTVMPMPKSPKVTAAQLAAMINLDEWIMREDFRGDEAKALGAISDIAGIPVARAPAIASASGPRGPELLTSAAGAVPGASLDLPSATATPPRPIVAPAAPPPASVAPVAAPAAPPMVPADDFGAEMSEDDVEAMLGELDDIGV